MTLINFLPFIFLGTAFISLWVRRDIKIWGTLLCLALATGLMDGYTTWVGMIFILALMLFWAVHFQKPSLPTFIAITVLSISFKLLLLPGYQPLYITSKFTISLQNPLIGLYPLALVVPLAKNIKDWIAAAKGLLLGVVGIAVLAVPAILSGTVHWDFALPAYTGVRILKNLVLTCIPEEGFYRGFLQRELCGYFKNIRYGNTLALIIASTLFTISHYYWSPDPALLFFVFPAGLLYGAVYLYSGRIESSILCHFLLNLGHMTLLSYHAA